MQTFHQKHLLKREGRFFTRTTRPRTSRRPAARLGSVGHGSGWTGGTLRSDQWWGATACCSLVGDTFLSKPPQDEALFHVPRPQCTSCLQVAHAGGLGARWWPRHILVAQGAGHEGRRMLFSILSPPGGVVGRAGLGAPSPEMWALDAPSLHLSTPESHHHPPPHASETATCLAFQKHLLSASAPSHHLFLGRSP